VHADEVHIDADLVGRLLAAQFPEWAGRPIEPVHPRGTDNAIYRAGSDLAVRLPCRRRTTETLEKERLWLPRVAPHLPLAVPAPLAVGVPGEGYPFTWSVYGWLEGENATVEPISDLRRAAADLAEFIASLQRIDPAGGPPPGEHNFRRGEPLANRDAATRTAIASLDGAVNGAAATAAWDDALHATPWQRPAVWIHGDLDARNLLVQNGRLSAAIDFGCLGVGDPACDVMVAWKLFDAGSRDTFRAEISADDATWARGRGWALSQAVSALSYYTPETNALLVGEAQRWLAEVLSEQS